MKRFSYLIAWVMLIVALGYSQTNSVDEVVARGVANYNSGNLKTAYDLFKQAMKMNPNHPEASKWFWKMKKEHDLKNLTDKGSPLTAIEPPKEGEQKTLAAKSESTVSQLSKSEKAIANENREPKKEIVAEKAMPKREVSEVQETKTARADLRKTAVLAEKMNRIDEKLSKLYVELKSQQKALNAEGSLKGFFRLSPFSFVLIGVAAGISLVLILILLFFRSRMRKIPPPPVHVDAAEEVAKKVVERLGSRSDDEKLLLLQNAKKLISQNPSASLKKALNLLALDQNETISKKSRLLLEMMKSPGEILRDENEESTTLLEPVERYAEGYLLLLQSKYEWDHSRKVRLLAREIGLRLGLTKFQMKELELAALLQNVGFIRIPDAILNKKAQLTKDEMAKILMHPQYSAEVAEVMNLPSAVVEGIRAHHERYNGNGYPARLSGLAIPLYARIIGLCDSFAALTSRKPFREQATPEVALEVLKRESYLFDPDIFEVFCEVINLLHFSGLTAQDAVVVQR
ncbi:MAG: HD domain-containing protein [Spirochaetes bacterium]|nr:HD domain-containing protein [Spirochaetota bacterium]